MVSYYSLLFAATTMVTYPVTGDEPVGWPVLP